MSLVNDYSSSPNSNEEIHPIKHKVEVPNKLVNKNKFPTIVSVNPDVEIKKINPFEGAIVPDETTARRVGGKATSNKMTVNVPIKYIPPVEQETQDPTLNAQDLILTNGVYGHLDQQTYSEFDFKTQLNTYKAYGYARDPSLNTIAKDGNLGGGLDGTGFVGDIEKAQYHEGLNINSKLPKHIRNQMEPRPKRKPKGDVTILDGEGAYLGPWAGYEGETIGEASGQVDEDLIEETNIGLIKDDDEDDEEVGKTPSKKIKETGEGSESTIFHGESERDYLGRTYMHVPQDLDVDLGKEPGTQNCFLPKKLIHTWAGHNKGVSVIRFFPKSGHLLLSAGMDGKAKLWDVYHDRRLLRTFIGHSKAIRDICFNASGSQFLTASYDKYIKLWDTETGKCIRSFSTHKIPYCVAFHPAPNKQHIFLAGCSNRKVVQFDSRSGDVTQEYDQHLGPVNTITFIDDGRKFITTSDDKTLRVWEFDIPVVVKYIAEPFMHSMPAVAMHPNQKWVACQSLDNQILIYGAKQRFSLNNKKTFTGHVVAGYACQPSFSPDGRFVTSGDGDGNMWFWDWKSTKILKKMPCHKGVLISCQWHPQETSKIATCSWDGTIKYWD